MPDANTPNYARSPTVAEEYPGNCNLDIILAIPVADTSILSGVHDHEHENESDETIGQRSYASLSTGKTGVGWNPNYHHLGWTCPVTVPSSKLENFLSGTEAACLGDGSHVCYIERSTRLFP